MSATTTLIVDTYKVAIGNYKFGEGAAARAVIIVILLAAVLGGIYLLLPEQA